MDIQICLIRDCEDVVIRSNCTKSEFSALEMRFDSRPIRLQNLSLEFCSCLKFDDEVVTSESMRRQEEHRIQTFRSERLELVSPFLTPARHGVTLRGSGTCYAVVGFPSAQRIRIDLGPRYVIL